MKKTFTRLPALCLSAVLVLALLTSCSSQDNSGGNSSPDSSGNSGKSYELSFTIHDPATSAKTLYYQDLAEQVADATDGKVNITVYSAGSLVASTDVAEGILNGVADIGWMCVPFFPNQFPLTEVVSLPMLAQSGPQASKVLYDLYQQSEDLRAETSQYKVFQMYTTPVLFVCANTPIYTVDDLKGLTMRAPAGVPTDMMTLWGASPVNMGPGDIYQAIEKNVIDGAVFEWSGIGSFNLTEVIQYYTEIPITPNAYYVVMNKAKWDALPAEYQQILDDIWGSEEASINIAELFQEDYENYRDAGIAAGVEIIAPTDDVYAEFKTAADQYIEDWAAKRTTSSFDAQAYVDLARSLFENTPIS